MFYTAHAPIMAQWVGTGLGRLPAALVDERARIDVQALAARLAEWPFVCGARLGSVDAGVTAMLVHVLESPFVSAARDEAERHPQLAAYVERVRGRFDVQLSPRTEVKAWMAWGRCIALPQLPAAVDRDRRLMADAR